MGINSMSDSITVLAAINRGYVQHLGVMLCSLFENNSQHRICAHVLCDVWDEPGRSRLDRLAQRHQQKIDFISVDRTRFERFPISLHLDASTYFRILCPKFLPASIDRVLYLDSDIVVRKDLGELWASDSRGAAVAAVADSPNILRERGKALGLVPGCDYFNAGVLLIDLAKWREAAIAERLVSFVEANRATLPYMDQDALNAVLARDWHALDPRWNRQEYHFNDSAIAPADLIRETAILHFTGRSKPWDYMNTHPGKREYLKYLALTEWRDFTPPDRSPGNFLRKHGLMPEFVQNFINQRHDRRNGAA